MTKFAFFMLMITSSAFGYWTDESLEHRMSVTEYKATESSPILCSVRKRLDKRFWPDSNFELSHLEGVDSNQKCFEASRQFAKKASESNAYYDWYGSYASGSVDRYTSKSYRTGNQRAAKRKPLVTVPRVDVERLYWALRSL
ncbi:MAG: hypothetical protein HOE90_12425 [Bacteriovoracaceae bacterium]|jgi:hypothetical protein|nr:hypothetical protein [Bacteriovoracaceae bacterium]